MDKWVSEGKIKGSLIVRNTALNFIGQVLPLLVAVATIPYVIRGLGVDRFGILSLAWVILGYFSLFDLGLGRATTKFVAEALGKGERKVISEIVWTSLSTQAILGIIGGLALLATTQLLTERILNIPQYLLKEAKVTFYLLSTFIPVGICSSSLRGVLEAAQRFDLVNAVKIPSNMAVFLVPAIAVFLGFKLPAIVAFIVVSWLFALLAYFLLCAKLYPLLKEKVFTIDISLLRRLFAFGGWVTVCNLLIPVLVALDRLFIGALLSVAAVGYYTAPYELISRLQIFPSSFALTLFPVFTVAAGSERRDLERFYAYSLKYLLIVLGPIVFIVFVFARNILGIWLGVDFAEKTSFVFQILALGMLLNAFAQMPAFLLDGIGRPDLRAKTFLLYAVVYIGLLWFLISKLGIIGAALAWTIRAGLELFLFFGLTWKIVPFNWATFPKNGIARSGVAYVIVVSAGLGLVVILGKTILIQGTITLGCLILFFYYVWRRVLEDGEKKSIFLAIKSLANMSN